MASSKSVETSPSAPTHPSPLNPHAVAAASSSLAASLSSPARTSLEQRRSLEQHPGRRNLERTSLERPLAGSLLSQIAANVHPVEMMAAPPTFGGASSISRKDGRPQPSLREALGRVRAGLDDVGAGPGSAGSSAAGGGLTSPLGGAGTSGAVQTHAQHQQRHQSALDRTDAVWAEMQQTLRDVELSTAGGTHFFGRGHPTALEELRTAQIALAQAWARGSAGDVSASAGAGAGAGGGGGAGGGNVGAAAGAGTGAGSPAANETTETPPAPPVGSRDKDKDRDKEAFDSSSQKSPRAPASEADPDFHREQGDADAAEADMAAARRRREASDAYFERVSRHVGEVTKKLEDVAVAMGKVEEESREGWSESQSES